MTRYTHAIICRAPSTAIKVTGKANFDLQLIRKQQEDLSETLREAGVDVIELAPEENCPAASLFADDAAIAINGTALITRPAAEGARTREIAAILTDLSWHMITAPSMEHGKNVVLDGSDVLYTGKEVFVGVRNGGTNMEGAIVVARTFADFAVIPVPINGNKPLKHYVALAANDVLAVGNTPQAKDVLKRIEREATFRYKTLTIEHEEAVNCINVNGHLLFRQDTPETKFQALQEPIELWGVNCGEMTKLGGQLSQYCLLVKKLKHMKNVW